MVQIIQGTNVCGTKVHLYKVQRIWNRKVVQIIQGTTYLVEECGIKVQFYKRYKNVVQRYNNARYKRMWHMRVVFGYTYTKVQRMWYNSVELRYNFTRGTAYMVQECGTKLQSY